MTNKNGNVCTIPPEIQSQIIGVYTSETPTPSRRDIAKRFGISLTQAQRLLKRYDDKQREAMKAELVVEAMPAAVAEVQALSRNLPISKMCKVLEEAEAQYMRYKDDQPQVAGGYLDQMRKCILEMGKWLGLDKGLGVQDNTVRFEVEWRKGR